MEVVRRTLRVERELRRAAVEEEARQQAPARVPEIAGRSRDHDRDAGAEALGRSGGDRAAYWASTRLKKTSGSRPRRAFSARLR